MRCYAKQPLPEASATPRSLGRSCLAAVIAAGATWSAGCGSSSCPRSLPEAPEDSLQAQNRQLLSVSAFDGEARLEVRSKARRLKARVLFFVRPPNKVRIDVMTQFGPVLSFASDGERITLLDLEQNRYIEGPACPPNIARLVGVALDSEALVLLLGGSVPLLEGTPTEATYCGGDALATRRFRAGALRQELGFALDRGTTAGWLPRSASLYDGDQAVWRATLEKYSRYPLADGRALWLPQTIEINSPAYAALLRLQTSERRFGKNVPDSAFALRSRPTLTHFDARCDLPDLVEVGSSLPASRSSDGVAEGEREADSAEYRATPSAATEAASSE